MDQRSKLSLDQLIAESGVKLESLEKQCSNEISMLLDLAEYCDPISVVGQALGLTKTQVSAIDNDYRTTEEKRLALMQKWKEIFAFQATYKTFVEGLLASRKAEQAYEVCRMLSVTNDEKEKTLNDHEHPAALNDETVSDIKPNVDVCTSAPTDSQPESGPDEIQQEGVPQSEAVSHDIDIPDNLSDDSHSAESSTGGQSQHVDSLVNELDEDYSQLGEAISNCLIEKEITMVQLQTYSATLPIRVRKYYEELRTNELPTKIRSAKTVAEFVAALNDYSNFLNPALIEDAINKFGDKKTKLLMCAYKTKLDEFQSTTTLEQFVTACSWEGKIPENYCQIELELKPNWEKKTFKDITPPKISWLYNKVFFGSLRVIFSIADIEDLEEEDVREYLQYHAKRVFVKGECVFNVESDESLLSVVGVENPDLELARLALQGGIDPDGAVNKEGMTPLMVVCELKKERLDLVELLLEYKAKINIHSTCNKTPLGYASREGHTEIVKLLLKHGADVNALNQVGRTALVNASSPGHVETARVLLEHGADTEIKNQREATAIHYAAQNGHKSVVELLLDYKANMEETNQPGGTALSIAAAAGHFDIVRLLLERGANVNAATKEHHQTPLMFASLIGDGEMVKLILSYHPDVNARSKNGITALMLAVQGCHMDVVHMLLKEEANPNFTEKETGWNALHIAVKHSHTYITEMLLNNKADPKTSDVSLFDISRVHSKSSMFELFATYGIKEEKGQRSEASANQLHISDKLLTKIFTQHATELHVQDKQLKRFLAPNADYVERAQVEQTSLGKEELNFKEQLKELMVDVIRTQKYPLSWKFGYSEKLIIDHKRDYLAKKYRDDVLNFQDQRRLLKTIKDLKKLSHENIASLKGVCFYEDSEYPVLVFEVKEVFNKTLDEADLQETSLTLRLEILHKVASGLTYLHTQKPPIIHYNLTARNVYVSESFMEVKIGGIEDGQIVDIEKLLRHFRDTQSIAVYMPPEILNSEPIFTSQFDIFSFGHLAMCTVIKEFSVVLLPHKDTEKQCTRTELERRQDYVSRMDDLLNGDHYNVNEIINRCLSNETQNRPKTEKLKDVLGVASNSHK